MGGGRERESEVGRGIETSVHVLSILLNKAGKVMSANLCPITRSNDTAGSCDPPMNLPMRYRS